MLFRPVMCLSCTHVLLMWILCDGLHIYLTGCDVKYHDAASCMAMEVALHSLSMHGAHLVGKLELEVGEQHGDGGLIVQARHVLADAVTRPSAERNEPPDPAHRCLIYVGSYGGHHVHTCAHHAAHAR